MNKNFLYAALFIAVLLCVGTAIWIKSSEKRIAYVRTAQIVEQYEGMKEAKSVFKTKAESWQSNIDTLEADYQRTLREYNKDLSKMSGKERADREEQLKRQEYNLRQYTASMEEKAKEEDERLVNGVLNQINSFLINYGKENGYDLILGVTNTGNIMYGTEGMDITQEVIKELNRNYKDESK